MKTGKKLLIALIAVFTLLLCFAFGAGALDASGSLGDNVFYTYNAKNGEVIIDGYGDMADFTYSSSPLRDINIKSAVIKDGVTSIGDDVFNYCAFLESVVIPDSVISIGARAFEDCLNLVEVKMGKNVQTIEIGAFCDCVSLESITLPDSITTLESYVFDNCRSLKSVNIPCNLQTLQFGIFNNCTSLEAVDIPDGIQVIKQKVFCACSGLKSITIPKSVTLIEKQAIAGCTGLTDIYYWGTEKDWNNIEIESLNTSIENATIRYMHHCEYGSEWTVDVYPTCTASGSKSRHCLYCENKTDVTVIESLGHSHKKTVTPPTCTAQGYTTYTCHCGDTYVSDYVKENGHSHEKKVTAPTCTAQGYTTYTCFCGDSYISDYVKAKVHSYSSSVTKEPTATEEGIKAFICSNCGDNYTEILPVTASVDEETSIKAEYDFGTFEEVPEMVIAEGGTNANFAFEGLFGKYTSFDITFEIDGEKVQPNGMVTVRVPIVSGYNILTTSVYYVDDEGNKTKIESRYENGYIVFETDHFSEYVLVDESSQIDPSADCTCNCHKLGFMGFIWKIINFFQKLFKVNPVCTCGVAHY